MFEGFSPEAIDFLWGIRFNNNKAWFEENKQTYLDKLYHPMKALADEVFEPFADTPGMICKVSRIYRDARLPNYALSPYKETLWFCIRHECVSWAQHPALFFEISPDGCTYGFGLIQPKAAAMTAFREQLADNPKPFLKLVQKIEKNTDITVGGAAYYRKKVCPAPELERFYQLKNIEAWKQVPAGDEMFSPALAEQVRGTLTALLPLYQYLLPIAEQSELL
jgi:uncharacterized protein (TIGR02453 family)